MPPLSSEPSANRDTAGEARKTARDRARVAPVRFLVDAPTAATALAISERTFHSLRKRADFPQDATVVLGPRCVRFRLDALHTFAISLVAIPRSEPRQLQQSRRIREHAAKAKPQRSE